MGKQCVCVCAKKGKKTTVGMKLSILLLIHIGALLIPSPTVNALRANQQITSKTLARYEIILNNVKGVISGYLIVIWQILSERLGFQ